MNNRIKRLVTIGLIILNTSLFSLEHNTYPINIVKEYENLTVELGAYEGPRGPSLFFDGTKIIFIDHLSKRAIYLDEEYNFGNIIDIPYIPSTLYKQGEYLIGLSYSRSIRIYDTNDNWKLLTEIRSSDFTQFKDQKLILYIDNTMIILDRFNQIWYLKNPVLDEYQNRKSLFKEPNSIDYISSGNINEVTIDNEKRLFINNILQTYNLETFYTYHSKDRRVDNKPKTSIEIPVEIFIKNRSTLFGTDENNNTYWRSYNAILILDKNSWPIDFIIPPKDIKTEGTPIVSKRGDIFFISYEKDKVKLYQMKREW